MTIKGLTPKEIVELRIKLLEPIILTCSKFGFEKHQALEIAEQAWKYAVKPIDEDGD
jgi:hypothetical protein